jgi:hypothetical protein
MLLMFMSGTGKGLGEPRCFSPPLLIGLLYRCMLYSKTDVDRLRRNHLSFNNKAIPAISLMGRNKQAGISIVSSIAVQREHICNPEGFEPICIDPSFFAWSVMQRNVRDLW